MRLTYLTVSALAAAFLSFPASAQSLPVCAVDLVAPAQGAHFLGSRPMFFQWSGEPIGTASRELHLAGLDGSETVIPLDGRFSDTVKVKMTGDLAWVVVFLDAAGNPLCTTPAGLLTKGAGGGKVALSTDSLSGQAGGPGASAAAKVSVFMNNGRLVIVLQNSPYTGAYTKLVAADSYDGSAEELQGASGLEIHGNNLENYIIGSPGADLIYAYGAGDAVNPGAGPDEIHVGSAGANFDHTNTADGGTPDDIYWSQAISFGAPHVHPTFNMPSGNDFEDLPVMLE
jgi:hypothetical protein